MKKKYRNMIEKMKPTGEKDWVVYIVRCGDQSLYTGITKNLEQRLKAHTSGKGAAYTRTHPPIALVYHDGPFTRSEALVREAKLKRLPKPKKEELVNSH